MRVPFGECGERGGQPREVGCDHRQRAPQLQHEPRIHGVLAGRAPMHKARGLGIAGRDLRRQRPHQGNRRVAGLRRRRGQRVEVELLGAAALADRRGGGVGEQARTRFGARQRRLEVEHRLHPAVIGEDGAHRLGREQRVEQALRASGIHDRFLLRW